MSKKFLDELKHDVVEGLDIFRLGVYDKTSYDLIGLKAGQKYPPHYHEKSLSQIMIVKGKGKIIISGKEKIYVAGDKFEVNSNLEHGFKPLEDTIFLAVQTPPIKDHQTGKEDIHFNKAK